MLRQLHIKNYTLIDELDMEFHSGFSVITGETGAGKSIILGAVALLLGQRADSKTVKTGKDKCVIEAHFDLSRYDMESFFEQEDIEYDATDTIVRRELTAAGKSRAFINDTPVALTTLKELGERLVDVHSQHQNLLVGKHDFQLGVVDIIAQDADCLADYQAAFRQYQDTQRQLAQMEEEIERNRQRQDMLQYQHDELAAAQLADGEQEELEQTSDTMTHSEDIKTALYEAETALAGDERGVTAELKKAVAALRGIERVFPEAAELAERVDSCYIELKDVAEEVGAKKDTVDFDPARLDAVNSRLDKIYSLQKKYHADSVAALLTILADLRRKLDNIENSDEALDSLRRQAERERGECEAKAARLTEKRVDAGKEIERQMTQRLQPLGMPYIRFSVLVEQTALGRMGHDKVSFLFSANASAPLQPVAQVASGGETARVMLALKVMISRSVKLPTIIFDEIDTGVSGKAAEQMAQMMLEMGRSGRQVVSITHLPQIAAAGTTHYKVYKEETTQGTATHMQMLNTEERVWEIAQMVSGTDITDAAIANAKQLLKIED